MPFYSLYKFIECFSKHALGIVHIAVKKTNMIVPRPVWLSWLGIVLQIEGSLV